MHNQEIPSPDPRRKVKKSIELQNDSFQILDHLCSTAANPLTQQKNMIGVVVPLAGCYKAKWPSR